MGWVPQRKLNEGSECQELISLGLFIGYVGNKISPYNFDILTRRMILNSLVGLFEENVELGKINDLKGVQFETLGFLLFQAPLVAGFHSYIVDNAGMGYTYIADSARDSKEVASFYFVLF